ncbi:hypothetical protein BC629DRAFT_695007 [Irpex lacteus]|nr:hypothetical protein BC629DRAFT_695007 [Irpex lacteus]
MARPTPLPSSYAPFHPHITLTTVPSSTPLSTLLHAIPSSQSPIPVTFKEVKVGERYFMSVYVTVCQEGEEEGRGLGELRAHLRKTLGEKTVPPVSHVSLFYIDDVDKEERGRVYEELVREGRIIELGEGKVGLDCSDHGEGKEEGEGEGKEGKEEGDVVSGFVGGEIWVAECEGPVDTWVIRDKIVLQ